MTDMWVAVTCEYNGSTFSHRAEHVAGWPILNDRAVQRYSQLLDEASSCVRAGLRGWLPPQQTSIDVPAHEKLCAIEKIVAEPMGSRAEQISRIKAVLKR